MKKEIIDQNKYFYEIIFDNSWVKWYKKNHMLIYMITVKMILMSLPK